MTHPTVSLTTAAGTPVKRLGYGAMVLEGYYGAFEDAQAGAVLGRAVDRGLMIDTADAYGNGHNETLVAGAIAGRRQAAYVATNHSGSGHANRVGY